MRAFVKLLNFEMNRFAKIYIGLMVLTAALQLAAVAIGANHWLDSANEAMRVNQWTLEQYHNVTGYIQLNSTVYDHYNKLLYFGPIFLSITVLLIYSCFIWYRDWRGKNTVVYRLLTLPSNRANLYFAKLVTILLFAFGFVALQIVLVPLENLIAQSILPAELYRNISVFDYLKHPTVLKVLIPPYFSEFVLYYGLVITGLIVLFTAILMERSYRLKGIGFIVLYFAVLAGLASIPYLMGYSRYDSYFYPGEIIGTCLGLIVIIAGGSLWYSLYLLRKKISV
ncbi:hypothetical protein SAMN04488689_105322 [Paenibacillus sp. cl6col]|uniref:ABC-2 family transporter protein n=1 Tax=Paenibacillus alvei TaxID=44250 RepID=A0A383REQ9_PAEAL|nr:MULTISPECIES: hypothetical protein [Paenibacillus]EPY12166.1 hypothetical protein PAAL66ix_14186 [Paenibacillus alvei A6-6i-x]MCY9533200.1 hypothetical protein [Paenibacillus alvei]SDF54757.1 hypothetical protein SAMN04488689_105322 [Paenibacillus sp. cl6col]SYX85112.1 conserved membrane protein of unknown function [Paenibacillus alvei]